MIRTLPANARICLTACAALALAIFLGSGHAGGPDTSDRRIGVGEMLPELALTDQHDRAARLDAGTRLLLFAPDRASSELAHEVLTPLGGDALAQAGIRYVADISAMPAVVTRMFALPKMRDYSYPVLLGRDPEDTAALPRRPGEVTLIRVETGEITDLGYVAQAEVLTARLEPLLHP
jgi:hypothetical protein